MEGLGERRRRSTNVCDRKRRTVVSPFLTLLSHTLLQIIEATKAASQNFRSYQSWIRKIARETEALPSTLVLKGVAKMSENAVSGGGFADIYVGRHGEREVALNVLRVFLTPENRKRVFRVRCFGYLKLDRPEWVYFDRKWLRKRCSGSTWNIHIFCLSWGFHRTYLNLSRVSSLLGWQMGMPCAIWRIMTMWIECPWWVFICII
jgi:hypothetical protein